MQQAGTSLALVSALALLGALVAVGCGGGSPVTTTAGPVITGVEPASGGVGGGTALTIRGERLTNPGVGANEVLVGGQPALYVDVVDAQTISCVTPPAPAGAADVLVVKDAGQAALAGGFTYYPAPTILSIEPNSGTRLGGDPVTVKGTGFLANNPVETVVRIGLKALVDLVIVDDQTAVGLTPSSVVETAKELSVENNNGSARIMGAFTYTGPTPQIYSISPDVGSGSGGTPVTIVGEYFTIAGGTIRVRFGDSQASAVTRVNDQTLTCVSPAHAPGRVEVAVSNANGESVLLDAFTFLAPPPTIGSVTPAKGITAGGTAVTIVGTGFVVYGAGTNVVTFGGLSPTNVVTVSDTTITCRAPANATPGAVNVVVTNNNGTATATNAFTYEVPLMYAATGSCAGQSLLYSLDVTASSYTSAGSSGGGTSGLAFHPTSGLLYATGDACNGASLRSIDVDQGTVTSIGGGGNAMGDITFVGTTLFGYDNWLPGPVTIDISNGSRTTVGTTSYWAYGCGLASDASGTNTFFAYGNQLYRVNTSSGAMSYIGSMSLSYGRVKAMTFHLGELYGVDGSYSGGRLIKINTSTATTSFVMALPNYIDALASNFPAAP